MSIKNVKHSCSRVLLPPKKGQRFSKQYQYAETFLARKQISKNILLECRSAKICPYCKAKNGFVKKTPNYKVIIERFRNLKEQNILLRGFKEEFANCIVYYPAIEQSMGKSPVENLSPEAVQKLFEKIPMSDMSLLSINTEFSKPTDLIVTRIVVPPNNIRPSPENISRTGVSLDDITSCMKDILEKESLPPSVDPNKFSLKQSLVQWHFASIMDGTARPPVDHAVDKFKPRRGLIQRLKGKQGRFRGNLCGKRVNYSARTVISPDPTLRIDQVGVPQHVANNLTFPTRVTPFNIAQMREFVRNGRRQYPGADHVIVEETGLTVCPRFVKNLQVGDIVVRNMVDGDIVLFNRQPSLHKNSIMAHTVKVHQNRTLRFNECVCTPYNADFDGDEMNLHFPQTYEAQAEAAVLMDVKSNLVTTKNGSLVIGATQDFITGIYLLTLKDTFFDFPRACNLLAALTFDGTCEPSKLPLPAIIKPTRLWTGKQIFNIVLVDSLKNTKCNLEVKKKGYKLGREFTQDETYVIIRNSELLAGTLDKSLIGSGSKKNIFYILLKEYGKRAAADSMWKLTRLAIAFLLQSGFSLGFEDVTPGPGLIKCKNDLLDTGYETCDKFIERFKDGSIKCQPGCDGNETLEQQLLSELSAIRDNAGKACALELSKRNPALTMAVSGSKGSLINISQMITCVGQQAICGKRTPEGFEDRGLPHFLKLSKIPPARGFVSDSFYSGLDAAEFVYHSMAGREGLVDTAVKTAETGYLQRRLMKTLEDLHVGYDGTVRNSAQDLLQFKFGGDGLDPTDLEDVVAPVDFERLFKHVCAIETFAEGDDKEPPMSGKNLRTAAIDYLSEDLFKNLPVFYKDSITEFLEQVACRIDQSREPFDHLQESMWCVAPFAFLERVTISQVIAFLNKCSERYSQCLVQPGAPVGATTATSLGEPATQMTLKTFHFAGVASMNITLGVPRIVEIINATLSISTPVITAQLMVNDRASDARLCKRRVARTVLKEIIYFIKQVHGEEDSKMIIRLNLKFVKDIGLELTVLSVIHSILKSKKCKIEESDIVVNSQSIFTIVINATKTMSVRTRFLYVKKHIGDVVVQGIPSVHRAVINQNSAPNKKSKYELLVEGGDLLAVAGTRDINGNRCTSNSTIEVEKYLGIEAARTTIVTEINHIMETHALDVNPRHVMLLADIMTQQGKVLGVTRHGLVKMNKSVLTLASFEQTSDHLFEAATFGEQNKLTAVSDCIVVGKPMPIGTGSMAILQKHPKPNQITRRPFIFDQNHFHLPDAVVAKRRRV